jgi:translation initiation factor IF-1
LAKEADGWDPVNFSKGGSEKLTWKCKVGHKWQARISNRALKGYGCPICSGQQILSGFNDLLTLRPEIAKQAHEWDPSIVALHSNKKVKWKCSNGHLWDSTVTNRVRRNDGCSVCSSHKTLAGFNDLATTDPEVALEAFGWDPSTLTRSSNKTVGWKCKFGHIWKARPGPRVRGVGCPTCSNNRVEPGVNDLKTTRPDLADQADGWDPSTLTRSSNKIVGWKCKFGHQWKTSVGARESGTNCPVCQGQKVLVGFNDLATTNPEVAREAYGWDPTTVTSGSTKKSANQWKCQLGHIWTSSVAHRTSGSKCPYCEGQKAWPGFNDLATTHPDIAKQAFGWDPTSLMAGSDKVRDWQCFIGHVWKTRIADRKAGNNCPFCSGQRVLPGFNDLATTHPWIAKEAHKWDPQTLTAGSGLKRKFKCIDNHVWETAVGSRTGGFETGCPSCAKTGFNPNNDGYIYFLKHSDWEMYQIGITNVPDDRLARHRRLGWEVLEIRGPMDGHLTQQWESAILRMLKAKGADLSNSEIAGKFDGYSEAWSKSTFEVDSIKELMGITEEFEEK